MIATRPGGGGNSGNGAGTSPADTRPPSKTIPCLAAAPKIPPNQPPNQPIRIPPPVKTVPPKKGARR